MEEIQEIKRDIRNQVAEKIAEISTEQMAQKLGAIENRLFEFANFLEANIALLYVSGKNEVSTGRILKRCRDYNKIVILPAFDTEKRSMTLMKVDNLKKDLVAGPRGISEPNPKRCKAVPIDCIDIAIVPSIALDEKGGRIGTGEGYYDRLIPDLSITTRKVTLALEEQIVPQVPMESHDRHVDIIITDQRIIYKI